MLHDLILILAVITVIVISFKDWFKALCFLLPLLAILERSDMPRSMLGIPGMNPFNISMAFILLGWLFQKGKENLHWDFPKPFKALLVAYLAIFIISFLRIVIDHQSLNFFYLSRGASPPGIRYLIAADFIDTLKWVIPGLLIFHGANSPERIRYCMWGIFGTLVLLGLQVISRMYPALIGADDLSSRALRVLDRNIGYHRVDLAYIMAGGAWALFTARLAARNFFESNIYLAGFFICSLAMFLTGGRAGYLAWAMCGIIFAYLRWRKLIVIAPIAFIIAIPMIPGLNERITSGFTEDTQSTYSRKNEGKVDLVDEEGRDLYQITSGRILLWPIVVEHIWMAPIIGHGMHAVQSLRLGEKVLERTGAEFNVAHPHNAYLELALDNGLIAAAIVVMFYILLLVRAKNIIKSDRTTKVEAAIAAMAMSFIIAHLVASIGAQSFYPKQGATLMWIAIGLLLRVIANNEKTKTEPTIETTSHA